MESGRNALNWIRAFLGNRSQSVFLEGEESDSNLVTSGVLELSTLILRQKLTIINSFILIILFS